MTPQDVVDLFSQAMFLVILIVVILVVPSLLVGLVISIFQAATQINEQTLSFLPRLLVTLGALVMAGPFIINKLIDFTRTLMASVPGLLG
jgi:flagellar biosynthetic protein FliQ